MSQIQTYDLQLCNHGIGFFIFVFAIEWILFYHSTINLQDKKAEK